MANYSFTKHGESSPTTLSDIDELLRKDLEIEPDKENFCFLYRWLEEIGFAILMSEGGSHVTEITYKKWREHQTRLLENENFAKHEQLIKKYLYGEYRFTGWR